MQLPQAELRVGRKENPCKTTQHNTAVNVTAKFPEGEKLARGSDSHHPENQRVSCMVTLLCTGPSTQMLSEILCSRLGSQFQVGGGCPGEARKSRPLVRLSCSRSSNVEQFPSPDPNSSWPINLTDAGETQGNPVFDSKNMSQLSFLQRGDLIASTRMACNGSQPPLAKHTCNGAAFATHH